MIQVLLSSFLYRNLPRITELVDPGVGFQSTTLAPEQLLLLSSTYSKQQYLQKNSATVPPSTAS